MGANASTTLVRVRYAETDQMGIAHHSSYVAWLELARVEWLRERSMDYVEIEASGLSLAVAGLQIRYLRAARFDDLVSVETELVELRSRRLSFRYVLRDEDGTTLATATTDHVPTEPSGRAVRLSERWRARLSTHLGGEEIAS